MGQKSNPNSFNLKSNKAVVFGNAVTKNAYAVALQEHVQISASLTLFMEQNRCFVKRCYIVRNNEQAFTTVFISFLGWQFGKKVQTNAVGPSAASTNELARNIAAVFKKYGHQASQRVVFQNLNKVALINKKNLFSAGDGIFSEKMQAYQAEPYFSVGSDLFCLMNTTKQTSGLFAKFIARFFKMFHRTRRISKFLRFLQDFVDICSVKKEQNLRVKGLKVCIKGRFSGAPRSKTRFFEKGQVPLQTVKHEIDYALAHTHTSYGVFGVKVWLFE